MDTKHERDMRTRPRHEAYLDAYIDTGYVRASGTVLSLSDEGLFAATPLPLQTGTQVTLSFQLPDLAPVKLRGEIIYRTVRLERPGVGIRFLPTADTRSGPDAIKRWCRTAGQAAD